MQLEKRIVVSAGNDLHISDTVDAYDHVADIWSSLLT